MIYLFGVLSRFQHCTGHITMGSWMGRGNQYIQLVKVLYCKLLTNGKQLPAFPLEVGPGTKPQPQRWEARVLPLCHCGPRSVFELQSRNQNVYGQTPKETDTPNGTNVESNLDQVVSYHPIKFQIDWGKES